MAMTSTDLPSLGNILNADLPPSERARLLKRCADKHASLAEDYMTGRYGAELAQAHMMLAQWCLARLEIGFYG